MTSSLKLLSWNARSIVKTNKDMLVNYCLMNGVNIFCIQETHLKPHINPTFKGFNILRKDRINADKGGILVGIKKNIHFVPIRTQYLDKFDKIEVQGCRVFLSKNMTVNIFNVYNPQGDSPQISDVLSTIVTNIPPRDMFIIVGDFNSHSNIWCNCGTTNRSGNHIEELLMNSDNICLLTPKNLPTRLNSNTGSYTTIDLMFSSPALLNRSNISCCEDSSLYSDHNPILLELDKNYHVPNPDGNTDGNRLSMSQLRCMDWNVSRNILNRSNVNVQLERTTNTDENIVIFQNLLIKAGKGATIYRTYELYIEMQRSNARLKKTIVRAKKIHGLNS